ncbi:hypothetical protein HDZ31DRAFT_43761 [Schizophyllum fasciatum]
MHNTFSQIRMCPECGDDLPLVGQQLWRTNETPQDTASFLRLRCSSCQVDYCCGCLADWATCARDLCRPTFPESDAPCLKGCAIGVFEILDALDRACLAHPLRAEEVPLELKASCELLMRVLAHPFHNGEDAHRAVGVLLAASRLPALLVLLFARETETRVWVARAELYRAALGVLWRIVGTPEVLVGLVSLPRVLRTCGLRAWLAGQGEISWVVAGDGGGGIGELVGVLAERRLELQQDMVLADAEVKKVLALLVGDIIAVEKQARLASLCGAPCLPPHPGVSHSPPSLSPARPLARDRTGTLLADNTDALFAPLPTPPADVAQPIPDNSNIAFQPAIAFPSPFGLIQNAYQGFPFDLHMQQPPHPFFAALQTPFFSPHAMQDQFSFPQPMQMQMHPQLPMQQPQQQPQQAERIPGKDDYELLKQVKDAILSGQHEHYKPIPQPVALADVYMGQLPADLGAQVQAAAARGSLPARTAQPTTTPATAAPTTTTPTNGISQEHSDDTTRPPPRLQNKEHQRRLSGTTAPPTPTVAANNTNGAPATNGAKPSGTAAPEPEKPVPKPPAASPSVDRPTPVKSEPVDPKAVPPPPRLTNGFAGPPEKDPRYEAAKVDAAAKLAREERERDRGRDRSLERERERRDSSQRPDYRDRRLSDARRPVPGDRHYEPSSYDRPPPREDVRPRVDDHRLPPRDVRPANYERAASAAPKPLADRIAPADAKIPLSESKSVPDLDHVRPATAAPRSADPISSARPIDPPRKLEDRIGPPPSASTRSLQDRIEPAVPAVKPSLESRLSGPDTRARRLSSASSSDRGHPAAPVSDRDRIYRPGSPTRAVYPPRAASVLARDDARSARGSPPLRARGSPPLRARGSPPPRARESRPPELRPSTYRPGEDERYDRRRDSMDIDRLLTRTIYDRPFSPPTAAQMAIDQERTRRNHYAPHSSPPPPPRPRVSSDVAYDEERRYPPPPSTRDYYAYDRERVRELDDELFKRRLAASDRDRYERDRERDRDLLPARTLWEDRARSPTRGVYESTRPPLSARLSDGYGPPPPPPVDSRYLDRRFDGAASPPYTGRVRPRSPSPLGRRAGEPPEKRRREEMYVSEYVGRRAEYAPPPRGVSPLPPRAVSPPPSSASAYYDGPGSARDYDREYGRSYRVRSPSRGPAYSVASYRPDPRDDRRYAPR